MDAVLQVLEKLLARTNENKIPWTTTVQEDIYVAVVGNTSVGITIVRLPKEDQYAFGITDETGVEIERVTSVQSEGSEEMFRDLFNKARRFARGTDKKLEALLAELDQV